MKKNKDNKINKSKNKKMQDCIIENYEERN